MIELSVGRLEVDWGKNYGFTNHSSLFQPTDLTKLPTYYVDETGETTAEMAECLAKPLVEVSDRLDLLGYTIDNARLEFEYLCRHAEIDPSKYNFNQLREALATVDVSALALDYNNDVSPGEFFRKEILNRIGLDTLVDDPHYVGFEAGITTENLTPHSILRLLTENPAARDLPVIWHFAELEAAGWAKRTDFIRPLDKADKFLIVTEGSSDANIIRHALKILKPHISDFFDFVDMEEGYPFSGTGNLYRFTQGLISISVINNIIILYDNDAEGVASCNKTLRLNLPSNMKVTKLPDLKEFESFNTIGPNGNHTSNINSQGAAIECYLDLGDAPIVRWNNYNKEIEQYQGELVAKSKYAEAFYKIDSNNASYDFSKILSVLEHIIKNCILLKSQARAQ